MEIELISAQTTFEASKLTLKKIDTTNLDFQNLVVVPDAFSMQSENLIFDTLDIKSTFNIEVVGISRLASKILRDANVPFDRISALEEVFCLYKAVQECKSEFQYFKSSGVEFCQQVLKIVKQFKACKISPDKIKPTGDENLDKKMHDLKAIYEKYEAFLGERLDLSKLLEFFLQKAEKDIDLSKINLFFINFDSFSAEIGSFITRLASKVNKTHIGMAQPKKAQKNAFIYEDDIKSKMTQFAKEFGVTVPIEQNLNTLSGVHLDMAENLFSFDVKKGKNDFFSYIVAKNRQQEVEYVAKLIKWKVANGGHFKDFAVAVSDEKYFKTIKDVFAEFGVAQYADDAVDLSQTILGHFLQKMFEISKKGWDMPALEYVAASPLLQKDEDVLQKISYFQIDTEKEFLERFPQYENFVLSIKNLQKGRFLRDFLNQTKTILEFAKSGFEKFLQTMDEEKYFKKQSENKQAWELLQGVLLKLEEIGGDEEFDLFSFENLFLFALKSVKVETIPTYIDAVFVGKATESYFEDVKTLFVLGASAGALPSMQADTGIIDDKDIKKLSLNFVLEPEIKVLNRRKRLKVFELLQHAQEKLVVCTPQNDDGARQERADFVNDLIALFGNNVVFAEGFEMFDLPNFSAEEELGKLLFEIGNRQNLMATYTKLRKKLPKKYVSALKMALKTDLPIEKKCENLSKSHFPYKNTISASELETYFACPFRHFLQYGLNLHQKENVEPTKAEFGNFEHALLKDFVSGRDVKNLTNADIEKFLAENVEKTAKRFYDEKILAQNHFMKYLKNESRLILKNVIKEQKNSDFRPIMLEKEILEPFSEKVKLKGFVDRVDKFGNYFRILDYKTGQTGSVRNELFYGKKLQLFLYASAMKKELGLDCAGVYYFDCKTVYNGAKKLFNGLTLKENEVIEHTDTRLWQENLKSDILGMSRKKDVKSGEYAFSYGSPEENFEKLFSYAKDVSQGAIQEIQEGFVAEKPFGYACGSCPFVSICRHGKIDGWRAALKRQKKSEVANDDEC